MNGNVLFLAGLGNMLPTLLMIGLVVLVFFFMFRSQKKQEKEANDMRNNLQIGDEITTIGGIIGEVVRLKDETVTIETGKDRTKIRILRTAIRSVDVHAVDKYSISTTPATEEEAKEVPTESIKASKKKKKNKEVVGEAVATTEEVNSTVETNDVAEATEENK